MSAFIKIKPTLVYLLFAAILGVGLARGQSYLQRLMGNMPLDQAGWLRLTRRWALFFVFLAGVNELVWRTQSTVVWVNFKVFGILPDILFMAVQLPLMRQHLPDGFLDAPEENKD